MFTIFKFGTKVNARTEKFNKCISNSQKYNSKNVETAIASGYQPQEVERKAGTSVWSDYSSNATLGDEQKLKFSMILPPPNVTGYLHLGHGLMSTVQDVICRRKRQQGYSVQWIPGTDHAGIATQVVVEKMLLKEKLQTRHQLGREAFLAEVLKWKNEKEDNITHDLKRMGCSLNWEREYFTMDEERARAVTEAFIRLFNEGIIKRKNGLVNWSCILESAISDIEVDNRDIKGPTPVAVPGYSKPVLFGEIHDICYKTSDNDRTIVVSTTRPETMLGDVAIAVHPDDVRYTDFHERPPRFLHPFRNELIPVVFDESVDREFGTGAVKITPAHDKNDFELAKRHSLLTVQVFTEKGEIADGFDEFSKLPRFVARERIINALGALGLYRGSKPHSMQLPVCSRSNDVIEYMLRPQWFLDCTEMAQDAIDAVKNGKIKIHPVNFEREWYRWLNDCRKWCISRQIWWGHQIPAYLCESESKSIWIAARSRDEALDKATLELGTDKAEITVAQDTDVLDTWFSSSLLPLSTQGWPDNSHCYPLDLMETGHDILFFWVARMVMMGQKLTGNVPFRNVLLNGIVCDVHGRKMSKSLGNVILPEQIIYGATLQQLKDEVEKSYNNGVLTIGEFEKSVKSLQHTFPKGIPECGTDALRFTLCSYNIKGHFINFDISECHTNKLFFNKIWQATRYTINACDKLQLNHNKLKLDKADFTDFDRWILSRLGNTRRTCNQSFETYNFHFGVNALKTFFYTNLCDVYLETTKIGISKGVQHGASHCAVLSACLSLGLQTMSPFTPFLAQELLNYLPKYENIIDTNYIDDALEDEVESVLDVCSAIRQFKNQSKISKKHDPKLHLFPENKIALKLLCRYKDHIQTLTQSSAIILENGSNHKRKDEFRFISTASHLCSFAITTNTTYTNSACGQVVNEKKLEKLQNDLKKLLTTISNDGYKKAANESVQRKHLEKVKEIETEISNMKGIDLTTAVKN